jgi:hypothetical protein
MAKMCYALLLLSLTVFIKETSVPSIPLKGAILHKSEVPHTLKLSDIGILPLKS